MVGIVLPATQDHPRSRGDNDNHDAILKPVEGSPPLTRGQPRVKTAVITGTRITPAHAGTTSEMTGGITTTENHPRSRGDNLLRDANKQMKTGSPPLTRGQPVELVGRLRIGRITPAHAGTTDTGLHNCRIPRDHPRSRGDNPFAVTSPFRVMGSPPLTRGQPVELVGRLRIGRITPAHAGTTKGAPTGVLFLWDHPRSRGDNRDAKKAIENFLGSPPLTRGQRGLQNVNRL